METTAPNLILNPLDPGTLEDGDLQLELVAYAPHVAQVPAYHFRMVDRGTGETAGRINLRLSWSEEILCFAGLVGYEVYEAYRGRGYASRALCLLKPLAWRHGYRELWITCNPGNMASRRSCEKAGAELVEVVDVPVGTPLHAKGIRQKCRYRLDLQPTGARSTDL